MALKLRCPIRINAITNLTLPFSINNLFTIKSLDIKPLNPYGNCLVCAFPVGKIAEKAAV